MALCETSFMGKKDYYQKGGDGVFSPKKHHNILNECAFIPPYGVMHTHSRNASPERAAMINSSKSYGLYQTVGNNLFATKIKLARTDRTNRRNL